MQALATAALACLTLDLGLSVGAAQAQTANPASNAKPVAKAAPAKTAAADASLAPTPAMARFMGVWDRTGNSVFDPATDDPPNTAFNDDPTVREHPPYNAEWEARYDKGIEEHKQGKNLFDPVQVGTCQPDGFPRVLGLSSVFEIAVTPKETWMIWELMSQVRRIFTDGRPHAGEEFGDSSMGDSIGHWEGDTLVVDTTHIRAAALDRTNALVSDQLHVTERWRLAKPDLLEVKATLIDPVAFTRPWVVTRTYKRLPPDQGIYEIYCAAEERNPVVNGQTLMLFPGQKNPAEKK